MENLFFIDSPIMRYFFNQKSSKPTAERKYIPHIKEPVPLIKEEEPPKVVVEEATLPEIEPIAPAPELEEKAEVPKKAEEKKTVHWSEMEGMEDFDSVVVSVKGETKEKERNTISDLFSLKKNKKN